MMSTKEIRSGKIMDTTENKVKHTPVPWHYQEESDAYTHIIRTESNGYVLGMSQDTSGKSEANARFIVRACNSHYDLLEALQQQLQWMKDNVPSVQSKLHEPWQFRIHRLETEIQKATS